MEFPKQFIGRTTEYATEKKSVCAPYLRRTFEFDKSMKNMALSICGLGFYHLYVNGKEITKGLLSPYISNPDHLLYCDEYDLTPYLTEGKNCIGILLGSGALNAIDGHPWDDEQLPWRSAPKVALRAESDEKVLFEADATFKTHDSPWYYEDMRAGERYDARKEIDGWNKPDFDDSDWDDAVIVGAPKGEMRRSDRVTPVRVVKERKAVEIAKTKKRAYLYDFKYNTAGLFRMNLKNAAPGQKVIIKLGEWKTEGRLNQKNIKPLGNRPFQECHYICKGGDETFTPQFSYYGYRYIEVAGINKEQATEDLFTMCEAHTDMPRTGDFCCSMPELNAIQNAAVNSDYSNFYHYPTDCPTREKNGWTGDASVSCEQMLLNIDCAGPLKEWLTSARKAQREDGALPTIIPLLVPTHDWGYTVGAVWDSFLIVICYRIYQYTGDKEILEQNADAIAKYLDFLSKNRDERGLLTKGLSDWLQPGRPADGGDSPSEVGLSFVAKETARMAKEIFSILEQKDMERVAETLEMELFSAIKKHLIQGNTVKGDCLTSQSLGILYDAFDPDMMPAAKEKLLRLCEKYDYEYAVGMVGTKVFPLAMSKCGYDSLLIKMMTDPNKPSYTASLSRFPTALDEQLHYLGGDEKGGWYDCGWKTMPASGKRNPLMHFYMFLCSCLYRMFHGKPIVHSLNHHFFGEPSHYFYTCILGLKVNPDMTDPNRVDVEPTFVKELDFAEGYHKTPGGKIIVRWEREDAKIKVTVETKGKTHGRLRLPDGRKEKYEKGKNEFIVETTATRKES